MHEMKEWRILRILAQESPKLELWLQRYGDNNFGGPICNFCKVGRGISRIIYENPTVFLDFLWTAG
jgi:hypothetical protein